MTSLTAKCILNSCLLNLSRHHQTKVRFAGTYKAAVLKDIKTPLVIEELKRPKLKKTEIRVQVAYCSVNISDVASFAEPDRPLPFVPGYEFSGEVLEVGKKVPDDLISIGEKVAALNFATYGGLAEECVVDMNDIWRVPPNLPLKEAAVIMFGHSTALYTFGKLSNPDCKGNVIVSVGPAGLGLAGVDVAANIFKKKVIAITDTEENSELTRERGAFQTLHYTNQVHLDVLKALQNERADIVYDAVGGYMNEEISQCISPHGTIFQACPSVGKTIATPPAHASLVVVSLMKLREQNMETYRQIISDTLEMADDEIISAYVSERFKLQDVNKAIEFIQSKKCYGKVVVGLD